ncbi:hypothetical protein [Methylosinus sp. PW1]|uniref:hypothetical protein n=1 Tax=Methylosinus sp. PW1 TaxID=107636 RepID=UPI00055EB28A|nr:hypothetical protein [Methylosinus sp. PW1]
MTDNTTTSPLQELADLAPLQFVSAKTPVDDAAPAQPALKLTVDVPVPAPVASTEDAPAPVATAPAPATDSTDAPVVADASTTSDASVEPLSFVAAEEPALEPVAAFKTSAPSNELVALRSRVAELEDELADAKSRIPPDVGSEEFSQWLSERFDGGYAISRVFDIGRDHSTVLEIVSRDGFGGKITFSRLEKVA